MKELNNIIAAYQKTNFKERKAVLATVLNVKGSSYRSPGAKMYITDDGKWVGTISGGCLEGDALRKARSVMSSGEPKVVTYDTMDDENNSLGVSLGCNGIIDVLLEPVIEGGDVIELLGKISHFKNKSVIATVFDSTDKSILICERVLMDRKGDILNCGSDNLLKLISTDLKKALEEERSFNYSYFTKNGNIDVFIELIEPNIDLMIFGGGFDAQPVANFAHNLGWEVRVIDECIAHLVPINFPNVNEVQSCNRDYIHQEVNVNPYSAAVLMSHNYHYDLNALKHLLNSDIKYIGVLGPKKKLDKMITQLIEEGVHISESDLAKIHGPIGLDIGAESPEEIAMSILTEIQCVFSSRKGGFLKNRKGHIHLKSSLPNSAMTA